MKTQQRIKIQDRFLTKLLISHILLASIPIILTGIVLIHTAQKAVEITVKDQNMKLARHIAKNITMTIENAENILKYNADNVLSTRQNRLAQEIDINTMVQQFPIFRAIKILNDSARVIISTIIADEKSDYRNEDFVLLVLDDVSYKSEVYLSEEMLPVMQIAEPTRLFNEKDGVLLAEVNLKDLLELVEYSIIGSRGEAFVFDKSSQFIAHSERKKVYLKERFAEEEILRDFKNNFNNQRVYRNSQNVQMVASYVVLFDLSWGVVVQQPTKEAFAVARKMSIQIILFVGISILLSSLIAFVYTRWIVTPVDQLVSGIDKFSTGDLKYRVPTLGTDEISMLAGRFNEMAEKLTQIQEKLKRTERLETLSKMASVLSHEIKNPLNAMVVNMQVMEREFNRAEPKILKLRHYLGVVAGEIQRVDDLVNNFLMVARPPKLDRKRAKIDKVLDELIIAQQAEALHSGVRINRRYQTTDVSLLLDVTKMKQVFLNILLNAIQAMQGGGNLIVELEIFQDKKKGDEGTWVVTRFKDAGKGMKKENITNIFDFYYSTKPNGSGLGLSVAQQIVEEHGGRIDVESEEGQGSVFSVFLPKS